MERQYSEGEPQGDGAVTSTTFGFTSELDMSSARAGQTPGGAPSALHLVPLDQLATPTADAPCADGFLTASDGFLSSGSLALPAAGDDALLSWRSCAAVHSLSLDGASEGCAGLRSGSFLDPRSRSFVEPRSRSFVEPRSGSFVDPRRDMTLQQLHAAIGSIMSTDEELYAKLQAGLRGISSLAQETRELVVTRDVTGATTINQYVVVKTLGRGSFGKVKLCLNTLDGRLYAVKARWGRASSAGGGGGRALQALRCLCGSSQLQRHILEASKRPC
jgi:hypothetical protein